MHDLGNDNPTLGSFDLNAHGIAVYGDSVAHPVTGLVIEGNEVDHLVLGASEAVVVNGNVDGWRVSRNDVHDNNNIGIDAIGYEPTLPEPYRYTDLNRARNGVIDHNTVRNIVSKGNPSYYEDGEWCNCADGIYVDGGTAIRIERNTVTGSDIGIEVAAENARGSADHVLVSRNLITRSAYVGIATGGYCNGGEACGGEQTGIAHDNRFVHNTLYANNRLDDGSPEVLVQYYAYRNTFAHNRVWATNDARAVLGTVAGADERRAQHAAEGRPQHVLDDRRAPAAGDVRLAGDDVHRVRHLPEGHRPGPAQPVRQVPRAAPLTSSAAHSWSPSSVPRTPLPRARRKR